LPDDWIFEVEAIILKLVPAYTLETLDKADVERLMNYYFWDYRMRLSAKSKDEQQTSDKDCEIVYRDGKAYKKTTAGQAAWANNIF